MRKYWLVYLLLIPVCLCAQTRMVEVIKSMPDTLLPYLDASKRTELVDFFNMGVEAKTVNKFGGSSALDTLTARYASFRLSESSTLQLLLLPHAESDTMLCAVNTYLGEAPESTVSFFTCDWQRLNSEDYMPQVSPMSLVSRPDTMAVEQYDQLLKMFDPLMTSAQLCETDLSLTWSLSTPMLNDKEKSALKSVLLQRKLKWDGRRFN